MPDKEIPQGAIRCDNGQYQAQCPECGEWIDVKSVEVKQPDRPDGQHPGYHTDPDLARYERHYRKEHDG
jgi:hypothetical protein